MNTSCIILIEKIVHLLFNNDRMKIFVEKTEDIRKGPQFRDS